MATLKLLICSLTLLLSFGAFAQKVHQVSGEVLDLGDMRGTSKFVLKLDSSTPKEFKVKFNYKYQFVSQELNGVFVGPSGDLAFSTRPVSSETYENKSKLVFDIEESTVMNGDDLELLIEVSRPNKNMHHLKVVVSLRDAKGNVVSGGRRLLGLLGRSYKISAQGCSEDAEASSL